MCRSKAFQRTARPQCHDCASNGLGRQNNGELLTLAEQQFDVFITTDQNLSFQQNLAKFNIAVFVLSAPTNRLADLKPLVPEILAKLPTANIGQVLNIATYMK